LVDQEDAIKGSLLGDINQYSGRSHAFALLAGWMDRRLCLDRIGLDQIRFQIPQRHKTPQGVEENIQEHIHSYLC